MIERTSMTTRQQELRRIAVGTTARVLGQDEETAVAFDPSIILAIMAIIDKVIAMIQQNCNNVDQVVEFCESPVKARIARRLVRRVARKEFGRDESRSTVRGVAADLVALASSRQQLRSVWG
jgi:hypothetical protein